MKLSFALIFAVLLLCLSPAAAKTIYVDHSLIWNCSGDYSISKRNGSGEDGDAYRTIVEAADVAKAGDTVLIRAGTYHSASSKKRNDVLWPKHSGTPGSPIVFKAYPGETVVLGGGSTSYPDDNNELSIARGVVTLKNVNHIVIENLQFKKVAGWMFGRNCHHIDVRNCVFEDATYGAKGSAKLIECQHFRFQNCSFVNSSFDSLSLEKCERVLMLDCAFSSAAHALLAMRGSSYNVIRGCKFANPYFKNHRAEKLVEIYDVRVDRRDPGNPVNTGAPAYNSTKYNLFESNFFGYHPFRPNSGAQPSAMQYSAQNGIVRRNIYSNPPLKSPDPNYPNAVAGGEGINLRWGGSWEGWKVRSDGSGFWMGEAHEAGFVTGNRFFHNVFYGYDNGCVSASTETAMDKVMNPPPLFESNPSPQFEKKFAYADNLFLNNIFMPGLFQFHKDWTWAKSITGKPIAVVMMQPVKAVRFANNDFYAANASDLIYVRDDKRGGKKNIPLGSAAFSEEKYPEIFVRNLQKDPKFVNVEKSDFHLRKDSPLIDAATFLTTTVGSATESKEMIVKDAGFFYDGFQIEGEQGDLIQLEGQKETARIARIDFEKKMLILDKPLSWKDGQGVALPYTGKAPDIGAFEVNQ